MSFSIVSRIAELILCFRLLEGVQLPLFEGRQPITIQSSKYFLLAFSIYYATAVLVLLPRTFALRLAIFPVTLLVTFRAATLLDFSLGNIEFAYLNQGLVVRGFVLLSYFMLTPTRYLWLLFSFEPACGHLD
jgi:hypothetical protein